MSRIGGRPSWVLPVAGAPPTTAEKVDFLTHRAWPGTPVEVVETHMSWVFLVGRRALKMKKPVVQAYLDYRTLADRRADCEAEVALNRRLAPGVYLSTVALLQSVDGRLRLACDGDRDGERDGEVVEWLVQMRRLARADLLDARLAAGDLDEGQVAAVVRHLVDFYAGATAVPMEPAAYRRSLAERVARDHREIVAVGGGLDQAVAAAVVQRITAGIAGLAALDERAGRLVDGHGDLRPEHVLVSGEPVVIDCISFSAALRRVDPVYDLALLSVECEVAGATEVGRQVIAGYGRLSGDEAPPAVARLYCAVRALTRSRLAVGHLVDGGDGDQWSRTARRYLALAQGYLADG